MRESRFTLFMLAIFANNIIETTQKEKSHQTQKATLSDVLMMKLVSYYEDKYKVADHEPTERGAKIPVLSENDILDGENKDALRIGLGSRNYKRGSDRCSSVCLSVSGL